MKSAAGASGASERETMMMEAGESPTNSSHRVMYYDGKAPI